MPLGVEERLRELFRRLGGADPQPDFETARELVSSTLNEVENEHSGVPYDPDAGYSQDGRMYPPKDDNRHEVPGFPEVVRYRTRKHNIYIRVNGAIEIQAVRKRKVVFSKEGMDGRSVWTE